MMVLEIEETRELCWTAWKVYQCTIQVMTIKKRPKQVVVFEKNNRVLQNEEFCRILK